MSNPSNLYAEKVYAEHPSVLWALDDTINYVSLITEAQRAFTSWTLTNVSSISSTSAPTVEPFTDSLVNKLDIVIPANTSFEITCVSNDLVNFSALDSELATFAVGGYFLDSSGVLQTVSIGYEYTDTTTAANVRNLKTYPTSLTGAWGFVSETFETPNENTTMRAVIKAVFNNPSNTSTTAFYVNGITIGQWSENHNSTSLGIETSSVTSANIAIAATHGIEAEAYGLGGESGYYITSEKSIFARNVSIPMVYGASGVTVLRPATSSMPSLVVPGKGFLNESGRHKEYTIEFWAKINSSATTPKKIFGPIASSDGLYVESGFLTFVIGKEFGSHFVGEWYRPMLVHIRVIRNSATVLVNGEEVININIDTDNLILPEILDNSGKEQDWLGFYAHDDVDPVEIDCVAIYPYQVATPVAKRRWVYGQGVVSPEGIDSAYGGSSAFIDYSFADYTANYIYPDFANWSQGTFDNLITAGTYISTPNYQLPTIFIEDENLQDLYDDNQAIQSGDYKFITFRPTTSWNSVHAYYNFPNFNILNEEVKAVYGVFSHNDITSVNQTLFKIYNKTNGNYFQVKQNDDDLVYSFYYNGASTSLYTYSTIAVDEIFAVGINIPDLVSRFGGNVAAFFGNRNGLELYVAGDATTSNTFNGNLYSFGLCTALNANEADGYFSNGFVATTSGEDLISFTASYDLLPTEAYDTFFLDIGVAGYWEDYLPLSYFAQYVQNDVGNSFYDLDFLQFNIGYPKPSNLVEQASTSTWTYQALKDDYEFPIQRTYGQLDNYLFTGWENYSQMIGKTEKYYEYDTADASIRSFITLQYVQDGANAPRSDFTIRTAREGSIIDIDDHTNWQSTKFEVVDNTLIYPTKTSDFNDLAIVYHLDFNIRGILTKPIRLRRLELASQAFNDNSFNPIGTRFGIDMFPYKRAGIYFDYKSKNPFSIYKGSTPYLYMNRTSGIQVRGDYDPLVSRGIAIPVNQNTADNYRVSALQMWMRYDDRQFPATPVELFEVKYRSDTIKFYFVADSETGDRARIYAKSLATGEDFDGISYYWNGKLVREPVATRNQWGVLGIGFSNALNFDSFLGGINLNGPLVFNNVAFYQANNLQQVQSTLFRPWQQVITDGITNYDWEYWLNSSTWEGVLVIGRSDLYGVNPSDVYNTYIGTNKIIFDDDEGLTVDADKIKVYTDTTWTIQVGTPV
jgi:hypothetical protein